MYVCVYLCNNYVCMCMYVCVCVAISDDWCMYMCTCVGFFFGRTSLIKLSPNKTWEGFMGAFLSTVIFGCIVSIVTSNAYVCVCVCVYVCVYMRACV